MKRVSLFDSRLASELYEIKRADKTSPVDIDNPDFDQYPLLKQALQYRIDIEVHAGDLLYIPLFWFHQVYTDRRTIAVSLWWDAHRLRQKVANEGLGISTQQILDSLLGEKWRQQTSSNETLYAALKRIGTKEEVMKQHCHSKGGLLSTMSLADLQGCKRYQLCKVRKKR